MEKQKMNVWVILTLKTIQDTLNTLVLLINTGKLYQNPFYLLDLLGF